VGDFTKPLVGEGPFWHLMSFFTSPEAFFNCLGINQLKAAGEF
jgi:hypothetical protein